MRIQVYKFPGFHKENDVASPDEKSLIELWFQTGNVYSLKAFPSLAPQQNTLLATNSKLRSGHSFGPCIATLPRIWLEPEILCYPLEQSLTMENKFFIRCVLIHILKARTI